MPKHGTKYLLKAENERLIDHFLDYKNYDPNTHDDVVWVIRRYLYHFETLGYESLEREIADEAGQVADVGRFLQLAEKYSDLQELDAAMVNELVDKIVIHKLGEEQ